MGTVTIHADGRFPAGSLPEPVGPLDFAAIYDSHAPFVWRAITRLGVADSAVEDVVQEVFLVVHRRLAEFEGRSSLRTWVFGIAIHVARRHRRTLVRRRLAGSSQEANVELSTLADDPRRAPDALLERTEAVELLMALLEELDDDLREVFVLAEIEEVPVPEIAEILNANTNTVYSRLRAARGSFDQALARARARDEWRLR
jgi:RNA polymerase sigma-70 factor (ECF subfamily)